MKNRIIALIDFSVYTNVLQQTTAWFAKALNAEVVLMHQVAGVFPAFSDTDSRRQVVNKEIKLAQQKLEALAQPFDVAPVQYAVSDVPLPEQIKALKSDAYADWVFLGLKGTGLLKRWFIGSTALEVIENNNGLTVALPQSAGAIVPRRLVIAVSENYEVNHKQLQQLLVGLKDVISDIEFITVDTGNEGEGASEQTLVNLQQTYAAYNSSYHTFTGDNALAEIKNHMQQASHAYLVLQRDLRSFDDTVLRRFMVNELVYNASIPLVILS